jgi:hypothetical protein
MSKVVKTKWPQMPIHLTPHPRYSPDLAPSGFFLFGCLKWKMLSFEFNSSAGPLEWIKEEFEKIPPAVHEGIFESWIIRVGKCTQREGDYFHGGQMAKSTIE